MEERKTYRLGEVINVLDHRRIPLSSKQREERKGHYPYYGAQGIIDYVDGFLFDGEYLLIAEDGENLKSQKQNVAQIAKGRYWVNNHAHIVESNGRCDLRYICYLLNQQDLTGYITGSAQPKLNQANLLSIELQLPEITVQKKVSDFLSLFDEKIALNNRINHNLLNVAQELFNSFISGKTYNTDTWRRASLLDIANYLNGLAMQKYPTKDGEVGLPVLKIKELGQEVCDVNSDRCSESIPEQYIVDDGDIIFSWSGTLLVDFWCGGRCGLNQHLFKVSSSDYPDWLIYFWTKHHLDRFIRIAKDKAVTMGHIKRNDLGTAEVVIPEDTLMKKLNDEISPIISEYIERRIENRKLQSFRDSLLPELISGRITC